MASRRKRRAAEVAAFLSMLESISERENRYSGKLPIKKSEGKILHPGRQEAGK